MTIKIALMIGGALLAATSVEAKPTSAPSGVTLRIVQHSDLNLATRSGRAKLSRRVALAFESVCGSYAGLSVEEQDDVTQCRRAASATFAPQLTKLLDAHQSVQSAMVGR